MKRLIVHKYLNREWTPLQFDVEFGSLWNCYYFKITGFKPGCFYDLYHEHSILQTTNCGVIKITYDNFNGYQLSIRKRCHCDMSNCHIKIAIRYK
jgi:hypothetical protein